MVYRPSREAGRWSSVEEESPSLPPSCRPAGCLQTTAILLPPTHPPPPEELGLLGMAMLSTHWLSSSYPPPPPLCPSRVGHAVNKQILSPIHPISFSWAWAFDKICNKNLWNPHKSYPYMFSLHSYLTDMISCCFLDHQYPPDLIPGVRRS